MVGKGLESKYANGISNETLAICRLHLANRNSPFSKSFAQTVISDGGNIELERQSFMTNDRLAKAKMTLAMKMIGLSENEFATLLADEAKDW